MSEWEETLRDAEFKLTSPEFARIIFDLKPVQLGSVEQEFLDIVSQTPISAYGISRVLKTKNNNKKERPYPYGNIHTRMQRLKKLGFIELEGKYSRNEIKFKITSHGLFQLMLDYGLSIYALLQNKDDIIVRTLLFQFFEEVTIQKFITYPRVFALRSYLRNITNSIIKKREELSKLPVGYHHHYNAPYLISEIENLIHTEIRQLVFLMVVPLKTVPINADQKKMMSFVRQKNLWFVRYGTDLDEGEEGPNYKEDVFPKPALMNDRKFLKILKDMKDSFESGCKDYMISANTL